MVSWEKLGSWAELVNPVDNVMYPRVETRGPSAGSLLLGLAPLFVFFPCSGKLA